MMFAQILQMMLLQQILPDYGQFQVFAQFPRDAYIHRDIAGDVKPRRYTYTRDGMVIGATPQYATIPP